MARVYIYDSYDNKFFRYNLSENDPMPYSTGTTLRLSLIHISEPTRRS